MFGQQVGALGQQIGGVQAAGDLTAQGVGGLVAAAETGAIPAELLIAQTAANNAGIVPSTGGGGGGGGVNVGDILSSVGL